ADMQGTVAKWGNSLALRLPRHIAESVRLTEGVTVELEIEDESLIVRPARKRFKLADLLADYEKSKHAEVDWGKPEGDEVW
ncbi:AbrB/MazE/SpoVT family DNA-binding domain-containing protein, partial [Shewanella sp. C31]|nr:AbrB/MazE/SpoVT family DNA-binding domain-containing protein [Shewanella electrica]